MGLLRVIPNPHTDEQRLDEGMVEICCEDLEAALAAGIVKVSNITGDVYLIAGRRFWAVNFCPLCGAPRTVKAAIKAQRRKGKGKK